MQEWPLEPWIQPQWLLGAYPVLKTLFGILAIVWLVALLRYSVQGPSRKAIGRAYRIFFLLIAVAAGGILFYQATWQLTGFARPDFVEFMRVYNHRPDNPVRRMVRGRIVDSQGRLLAVSSDDATGRRWYPQRYVMAHAVGYQHHRYGLAGIEAADHALLSGLVDTVNPDWGQIQQSILQRERLRGRDIQMTLDLDLQRAAHEAMQGRPGAVVFLDLSDGSLLVCYSSPGFDPNQLNPTLFERNDAAAPLLNRALRGLYPPGSSFKLLVAAAALEIGLQPVFDTPPDGFTATGANQPIRDHQYYAASRAGRRWRGYGPLSMREAFAKSSNTYFARLGVTMGGAQLYAVAEQSGMTRAWTIHSGSSATMGSVAARFPPLTDPQEAATAQISIGQGELLVTPLHMALLAGAAGNGGDVWQPRIATHISPQRVEPFFSQPTAEKLAEMMRQAVAGGTGRAADFRGVEVAGKTGTAQNPHGNDHGWFIGFAPAAHPRVAFAVIVEQGGFGSESALPVARTVLQAAQRAGWLDRNADEGRR